MNYHFPYIMDHTISVDSLSRNLPVFSSCWVVLFIHKLEICHIHTHHKKSHQHCQCKSPFQELALITHRVIFIQLFSIMREQLAVCRLSQLDYHQHQIKQFQVCGSSTDSLVLEIQVTENGSVVDLCNYSEDEKLASTWSMPLIISLTCVDVCCTAHQQEWSHDTHDQHYCGFVFVYVDNLLSTYSLNIEVVDKPS